MKIQYCFDGGGSHLGKPASWGWVCYIEGIEYERGYNAMAPGTTNNVAEYEALIMAVEHAIVHDWQGITTEFQFYGDSLLVVNQVSGLWRVKNSRLRDSHWRANRALSLLGEHTLTWHPRECNERADELARLGRARWRGPA